MRLQPHRRSSSAPLGAAARPALTPGSVVEDAPAPKLTLSTPRKAGAPEDGWYAPRWRRATAANVVLALVAVCAETSVRPVPPNTEGGGVAGAAVWNEVLPQLG